MKSPLTKAACRFAFAGCSVALILACSGKEFSSDPVGTGGTRGGGGGRGGTGGMSGSAGVTSSGGTTPQGGDSGSSGSGGSAGCACGDGQYCRAGKCRDCNDPSVFEFGAAEALTALGSDEPNPSFPRSGGPDRALFYSSEHTNPGHIYFTPDFSSDVGTHVSGQSAPSEFGPLFIEDSGGLDFDFLFTRVTADGPSMIMTADWDPGTLMFSGVMPAPGALNAAGSNQSVAFASGAARFWWMSTRNTVAALYTTTSGSMSEQEVALDLPGPCPASYPDYTPWVTSDGDMLLFAAQSVDAQCVSDGTSDLYFVSLGSNGQPATQVFALDDVNLPGSDEVTPSLSPDSCYLYFASNSGGGYAVYRAPRR